MNFSTYFSKQARKPTGLVGRLIASRLFEKGNSELNALMFETLSKSENEHVLEIGFGTGKLIKEIADHMDNGVIEGVDFSETMVEMAKKKNIMHIKTGKVNNRSVFKYYSMQDLKELLSVHGSFDNVNIISKNGKRKTCYCAVGTRLGY